ncbi:MAG: hypothetical protein WEA80_03285 [Gemmatimonadaceae bacterium]
MAFPPERNHKVSLEAAAVLTRGFREVAPHGSPLASLFPRDVFERLLAQPRCAGIRIYYGRNDRREHELLLVGVDGTGDDMTAGELFDFALPCPPYCGGGNVLNGEQA